MARSLSLVALLVLAFVAGGLWSSRTDAQDATPASNNGTLTLTLVESGGEIFDQFGDDGPSPGDIRVRAPTRSSMRQTLRIRVRSHLARASGSTPISTAWPMSRSSFPTAVPWNFRASSPATRLPPCAPSSGAQVSTWGRQGPWLWCRLKTLRSGPRPSRSAG